MEDDEERDAPDRTSIDVPYHRRWSAATICMSTPVINLFLSAAFSASTSAFINSKSSALFSARSRSSRVLGSSGSATSDGVDTAQPMYSHQG